jgi:hypothetical protein
MSLRALAESDSTAMLDIDGDDITLISPALAIFSVRGQYIRRGVDTDPGTGLPVSANVSAFTISLSALAALGLTDPESLKDGGWVIESTDVTGVTVRGRIMDVQLDRTIGRATITAKV